jgi:enoyl-CoA hydratase/carnithine racemase
VTTWTVSEHGRVAVATFTRPPRNFMSFAAMEELERLLGSLADRQDLHVVVLTGGVPGYFVAHADVEDLARLGRGEPVEGDPLAWHRALALIESMPQPVVAAVGGQAWGGGCELSLACDLRVAAAAAHFSQPEVTIGIIPGAGGTQRLPRLVGPGRAAALILSGRVVSADAAFEMGLVEAVLPDDGFLDHVLEWVGPIADKPRHALAAAKRAMHEGLQLPLAEGLRVEGRLFLECQATGEAVALEEAALERYDEAAPAEAVTLDDL